MATKLGGWLLLFVLADGGLDVLPAAAGRACATTADVVLLPLDLVELDLLFLCSKKKQNKNKPERISIVMRNRKDF